MSEHLVIAAAQNAAGEASSPADPDVQEIERLRSTCSFYDEYAEQWRFFLRSYEGGLNYCGDDTIFRHSRETNDDYQDRLKRARYDNYCQSLVDFVPEYIFSQGIEREANSEVSVEFATFIKDCDRKGTTLNSFMQEVAENIRIFGMTHVLVDTPKINKPSDEVSLADVAREGIRPYIVHISPLEIIDWTKDEFARFSYAKRKQVLAERQPDRSVRSLEIYTEWDRLNVEISVIDVSDEKNPKLLHERHESIPNEMREVPILTFAAKRKKSRREIGHSFLEDLAYQNRHIANMSSLIDEFLYRQCFSMLMVPESTSLPKKTQIDGRIGTANVLTYPKDASKVPSYLAPPPEPAEFIQEERANAVREMYRHAAQDVMSDLFGGRGASGDAEKQKFSRTIPVINRTADALEEAEQAILALWAKRLRREWKGKISYKDDYSVTNVADLILELSQLFNSVRVMSPTFWREEWKRLVRELDGKISREKLETIYSEIDEFSDDEIMLLLNNPTDVKASFGVPSTANLAQGEEQTKAGSDKKIAMAQNSQAANKEKAPDADKRVTRGGSKKRPDRRTR